MRFRIQTDGEKFRVQGRYWNGWSEEMEYTGNILCRAEHTPYRFATEADAIRWICRIYGEVAVINRHEWRNV